MTSTYYDIIMFYVLFRVIETIRAWFFNYHYNMNRYVV